MISLSEMEMEFQEPEIAGIKDSSICKTTLHCDNECQKLASLGCYDCGMNLCEECSEILHRKKFHSKTTPEDKYYSTQCEKHEAQKNSVCLTHDMELLCVGCIQSDHSKCKTQLIKSSEMKDRLSSIKKELIQKQENLKVAYGDILKEKQFYFDSTLLKSKIDQILTEYSNIIKKWQSELPVIIEKQCDEIVQGLNHQLCAYEEKMHNIQSLIDCYDLVTEENSMDKQLIMKLNDWKDLPLKHVKNDLEWFEKILVQIKQISIDSKHLDFNHSRPQKTNLVALGPVQLDLSYQKKLFLKSEVISVPKHTQVLFICVGGGSGGSHCNHNGGGGGSGYPATKYHTFETDSKLNISVGQGSDPYQAGSYSFVENISDSENRIQIIKTSTMEGIHSSGRLYRNGGSGFSGGGASAYGTTAIRGGDGGSFGGDGQNSDYFYTSESKHYWEGYGGQIFKIIL
jgi:hypothetical protein